MSGEPILSLGGANPIQIPSSDSKERAGRLMAQIGRGWRLARRLFHVLVGITFLFFAAAGVTLSLAEWRTYLEAPSNGPWRLGMMAGFTLLLLIFGLYSFVKARSVR
jgi:hypothetical protein